MDPRDQEKIAFTTPLGLYKFQRLMRPDKCKLLQNQVKFWGHIVDHEGVRPDPDKVAAVRDWPVPSTICEVHTFLGLAGYYRCFCACFCCSDPPQNSLLTGIPADKKSHNRMVTWSPQCQQSFDVLKAALTQAPVQPFIVYTEASGHGSGAQNYWSKTISPKLLST